MLFKLVNAEDSLKTPQKMEVIARFDYSDHNLQSLIDDDWSKAYIDDKVIIYKDKMFPITNEHMYGKYKPKTFKYH